MFTVQMPDVKQVISKLERMQKSINALEHGGLTTEVRDWEVQDVHRKRPGARNTRSGARVFFRPHSRYEMRRHKLNLRRLKRRGVAIAYSTRPILRRTMIDRLWERVTHLVEEKLTWKG